MAGVTRSAVEEILASIRDETLQADARELVDILWKTTGEEPEVWSSNTIGFGRYRYRYATGTEGEFFEIGFAARSDRLTLYVMSGLRGFEGILARLGPHQSGKSTVHVKSLTEIDFAVLRELARECVAHIRRVEDELGAIPRMSEIPPRPSDA